MMQKAEPILSLLEVGRFRCRSEGGLSPVLRLKHKQAGSLFVCCFQTPKFLPALFLTLVFSLLPFPFSWYTLSSPAAFKHFICLNKSNISWNKYRESLIKNKSSFSSEQTLSHRMNSAEVERREAAGAFFKLKVDGLSLEKQIIRLTERKRENTISPSIVKMQSRMARRAWTLTPILRAPALHSVGIRLASHWHDCKYK